MIQIEWLGTATPISREDIQKVEEQWCVRFPEDYIQCALHHHGLSPIPDILDVENQEEAFNYLLSYDPEDPTYLVKTYENIKDRLVARIYPIADDPGGNMICFDYRNGDVPNVVFWDHEIAFADPEQAITPICSTFTELLNRLRPFEDE